jgi:ribonuclease HI
MDNPDLIIFTDGSGKSSHLGGKACAVLTKDGETPFEILYREYKNEKTCNESEYNAVILALEGRLNNENILIKTDSNLVVNQLNPIKPWQINFEHLRLLNSLILDIIRNLNLNVELEYVPRDDNLAGRFIEGKLVYDKNIVKTETFD